MMMCNLPFSLVYFSVKDLSFGFISYVKSTCSWLLKWVGYAALAYYTMAYFSLRLTPKGTIESTMGKFEFSLFVCETLLSFYSAVIP